MKRLLVLATLVSASSAFAAVQVEFRGEHSQTNTTTTTTAVGAGAFGSTRARVNLKQKINDTWNFQGQVDLLKIASASTDGTSVNHFFVSHMINENGTLMFGKQTSVGLNGAERFYGGSTTDGYFTSATYKDASYRPNGMMYRHKFGDSTLNVILANNDFGTTVSGAGSTNGMAYGLTYTGKFGKTTATASYHSMPDDPVTGNAGSDTYMSLGADYKADNWSLGLTYSANTNASAITGGAGGDLTASSLVANFAYKMGKWRFPVKFESSSGSLGGSIASGGTSTSTYSKQATDTISQYLLGAEWSPTEDHKNLRYHLIYMSKSSKFDATASANTNTDTVTVLAGFKIITDVAK